MLLIKETTYSPSTCLRLSKNANDFKHIDNSGGSQVNTRCGADTVWLFSKEI